MTKDEIIEYFQREYPGKNIVLLPESNPTEIICETEPATMHPDYSRVIAAIQSSVPHYHAHGVETYTVLEGELRLHVEGRDCTLKVGDRHIIQPNQIHYADGAFTLVQVDSVPGWTPEDHILANEVSRGAGFDARIYSNPDDVKNAFNL